MVVFPNPFVHHTRNRTYHRSLHTLVWKRALAFNIFLLVLSLFHLFSGAFISFARLEHGRRLSQCLNLINEREAEGGTFENCLEKALPFITNVRGLVLLIVFSAVGFCQAFPHWFHLKCVAFQPARSDSNACTAGNSVTFVFKKR